MSKIDDRPPAEAVTIQKTISLDTPPGEVWAALRDVGALHTRLAIGFVVDTRMDGDTDRIVTFANGMVARERILAVEEDARRLVYSVISDQLSFHRATAQVSAEGDGSCFVWTAVLAPAELAPGVETMMEAGCVAMKQTIEAAARAA